MRLPKISLSNRYFVPESRPSGGLFDAYLGRDSVSDALTLVSDLSPDAIARRHKWLTYSEPEGHADHVREMLAEIDLDPTQLTIAGLTWKDEGLLVDLQPSEAPKIEFARNQVRFTRDGVAWSDSFEAQDYVSKSRSVDTPRIDLLVCRHLLEHALNPTEFLEGLSNRLRSQGHLLIEVPDSHRQMQSGDFSMLWEEHRAYYTARTLRLACRNAGWGVQSMKRLRVDNEDVILAILSLSSVDANSTEVSEEAIERQYLESFPRVQAEVAFRLSQYRRTGTIALLGANHAASMFVDLFAADGDIAAFIDDHPMKQGAIYSRLCLPIRSVEQFDWQSCALVINAIRSPSAVSMLDRIRTRLPGSVPIVPISNLASGIEIA